MKCCIILIISTKITYFTFLDWSIFRIHTMFLVSGNCIVNYLFHVSFQTNVVKEIVNSYFFLPPFITKFIVCLNQFSYFAYKFHVFPIYPICFMLTSRPMRLKEILYSYIFPSDYWNWSCFFSTPSQFVHSINYIDFCFLSIMINYQSRKFNEW